MIKHRELKREVIWTESLAVGDRTFVDSDASGTENRRRFTSLPVAGSETAWSIREFDVGYNVQIKAKNQT